MVTVQYVQLCTHSQRIVAIQQKSVLWHLEAERAPSRSIGQSCEFMQINVVAWISLLFGATFCFLNSKLPGTVNVNFTIL